MSFKVPVSILHECSSDQFSHLRSRSVASDDLATEARVNLDRLTDKDLEEIRAVAREKDAKKFLRALDAVIAERSGTTDWKVPSFGAFERLLRGYLAKNFCDGWIYEKGEDGCVLAYAVSKIHLSEPSYHDKGSPTVNLTGVAWGIGEKRLGRKTKVWQFAPGDVSRRHVAKILEARGLYVETDDLRSSYDVSDVTFSKVLKEGFAELYRVTGPVHKHDGYSRLRDPEEPVGRRVIMDIDKSRIGSDVDEIESGAFSTYGDSRFIEVPRHPLVEVYDLSTHEPFWINTAHLEFYRYKPELRSSLILPEEQRDLLDILTTDTDLLTGDIIEGKAAGNIILAKGVPGTGKTLTAEIYSEVIKRPLYSVHAGVLGTNAKSIAENLRKVFQRAQRWNCILLLDEADVFVMQRGVNVEQNAIVAEFLRTLEHYDGLMFMTTNRPDDIDDAILSRCAAIIHYDTPCPELASQIWRVMAKNFDADLPSPLIDTLVQIFPGISARDIKMLLRLTLRVANARGTAPAIDDFRKCAMFRGINATSRSNHREGGAA